MAARLALLVASGVLTAATWVNYAADGNSNYPTTCADGSNFFFSFRKSSAQSKLVIEFEGGGACWDATTCGMSSTYSASIDGTVDTYSVDEVGLRDLTESENPFADWNYVFVPCE